MAVASEADDGEQGFGEVSVVEGDAVEREDGLDEIVKADGLDECRAVVIDLGLTAFGNLLAEGLRELLIDVVSP